MNVIENIYNELYLYGFSLELIARALLDNWFILVVFMLFVLIPFFLVSLLLRSILDKLRRIKRLDRVVISENAYITLSVDAKLSNMSVRKRIERILNFVAGQEEIIKRIRD